MRRTHEEEQLTQLMAAASVSINLDTEVLTEPIKELLEGKFLKEAVLGMLATGCCVKHMVLSTKKAPDGTLREQTVFQDQLDNAMDTLFKSVELYENMDPCAAYLLVEDAGHGLRATIGVLLSYFLALTFASMQSLRDSLGEADKAEFEELVRELQSGDGSGTKAHDWIKAKAKAKAN